MLVKVNNNVGWAEPHSRFPLWNMFNLSRILLEVAEMSIHVDRYVLLTKLNVSVRSDKWLPGYSTFNILRWYPIGCCLYFEQFSILVWFPKHEFKFSGISDQWLLRYFILNISRFRCWSSSFWAISIFILVPYTLKFQI